MNSSVIVAAAVGGFVGGLGALAAQHMMRGGASLAIKRIGTTDPRSSSVTVYNNTVYTSGQVGDIEKLAESDITAQTEQTLRKVESLLEQAGTSKSKILEARVWVKDINRDFAAFNKVWNAWVDPNNKGCRYCVESPMARPGILVEIQVVAAL